MISPYVFPGLRDKKIEFMSTRWKRNEAIANNIIQSICFDHDVRKNEVIGTLRFANIVRARYLSVFLIRKKTDLSLKEIGKIFNRDHATVMYAIDSIKDQISYDKVLRAEVERLTLLF